MAKFVVVFDQVPDASFDDKDGEGLKKLLEFRLPGANYKIYPIYRSAYDIDYNMTKFLCMPPVGDPQPLLANEEYLFKIGIATTPENFEKIQSQVEHMASALSVDYLSYESHGKPVEDGSAEG